MLLLKANHVLGADGVGPPQILVEVLAVDSTELGCGVVNEIERDAADHGFQLSVLSDVATEVVVPI